MTRNCESSLPETLSRFVVTFFNVYCRSIALFVAGKRSDLRLHAESLDLMRVHKPDLGLMDQIADNSFEGNREARILNLPERQELSSEFLKNTAHDRLAHVSR